MKTAVASDDEEPEDVHAAFNRGAKGLTGPPSLIAEMWMRGDIARTTTTATNITYLYTWTER